MNQYKVGVAVLVRWNIKVEANSTKEAIEIAEEEVVGGAIGYDDWQMDMFDAEPVCAHIKTRSDSGEDKWQQLWERHSPYNSE